MTVQGVFMNRHFTYSCDYSIHGLFTLRCTIYIYHILNIMYLYAEKHFVFKILTKTGSLKYLYLLCIYWFIEIFVYTLYISWFIEIFLNTLYIPWFIEIFLNTLYILVYRNICKYFVYTGS